MGTYKRQLPGKRVSARIINQGVEAREILDKITCAPGLNITTGATGISISQGVSIPGIEIGIAVGDFGVASGSTLGTGTVALYQASFGGTTAALGSVTQSAFNWYANSFAPNGARVFVVQSHGVRFVIDWDCA